MSEKVKKAPSTVAGLVRYDEEDKESLIKLKPIHVVALCIVVIILEVLLFFANPL